MQNLKQTLNDVGLSGVLTVRENGAVLPLSFKRGERSKLVHVSLGAIQFEAEIHLVDVENPGSGPNLTIVLTPTSIPVKSPVRLLSKEEKAPLSEPKTETPAPTKLEEPKTTEIAKTPVDQKDPEAPVKPIAPPPEPKTETPAPTKPSEPKATSTVKPQEVKKEK